jgi:signal transduction histidine kinase
MRPLPRSLAGRLLGISVLTTIAALVFAAFTIGHVLERFVIRSLDQQLAAESAMLVRAIRPDGTIDPARIVDLPMFAAPERGWGWQVVSPRGRWVGGDMLDLSRPRLLPGHRPDAPGGGMPGEAVTRSGEPVHTREWTLPGADGDIRIVVGGPRRIATAPLREAMVPLIGSLLCLGVALALAILLQLRFGLRPLRTLQSALAEVRAGRARHVPSDQPDELAPLANELNALIDQNEAQLAHARRHVANLAHGLKTPLAALSVKLAEGGHDADGSLAAMVRDIDGRVRHHLGRARAAAPGGGSRARTLLAPAVADLLTVLRGIHAGRGVRTAVDIAADIIVAADPEDIDEMLGNLLDNAFRHAACAVAIRAAPAGPRIDLIVEDDGPGLSNWAIGEALLPGRRLDERGDGHGFGLPIAQELAELNGGTLSLTRSAALGGLRVTLSMPLAA